MPNPCRYAVLFVLMAMAIALAALALAEEAEALPYDVAFHLVDDDQVRCARNLDPLSFNFTLKHTGEVPSEEVQVEFRTWPLPWQYYLTATTKQGVVMATTGSPLELLLQRGETALMSLTISPPREQPNSTFWFTLKAFPKREPTIVREQTVGVVIPQYAAFEILVWNEPVGGFAVMPPSQVTLRFALFNKGNGVDRFLIQYESSRADAGWALAPVSGIDEYGWTQNVSADPAKQRPYFIDMRLVVPAEERAEIACQVTVVASSLFDQTLQMPPAFTTVRTLQYCDFSVRVDGPDRKDGVPGGQVDFALTVTNNGNGDDVFTVRPTWSEEDCQGFLAATSPHTIKVPPGGTGAVACIVVVPQYATRKVYYIGVEVASSDVELPPITKTLEVDVGQFFAVSLSSPQGQRSTVPGEVLSFEVVVRNAGNGLDTVLISLLGVPVGWYAYSQPVEAVLLQQETKTVVVTVVVPSTFEEAPIGSNSIVVSVRSTRSSAMANLSLAVDVVQFYKVDWMYNGEAITDDSMPVAQLGVMRPRRTLNPYERNSLDVTLEVRNGGNGDDEVALWGFSMDPRASVALSPARTALLRDQTKPVKVHVEVPLDLPPGIYVFYANLTCRDATRPMKAVPIDVEVFNLDARVPPVPTYNDEDSGVTVRPELSVDAMDDLTFSLRVENAGTKPMPSALVRVYDVHLEDGQLVSWNFLNVTTPPIAVGDKFVVGEAPFSDGSPPIAWTARVPGEHTLEFRVFLDHQSRADDDVASVNVTVRAEQVPPPPPIRASYVVVLAAIVTTVLVAAGYSMALRRRPAEDADLYGSIYGEELEDESSL